MSQNLSRGSDTLVLFSDEASLSVVRGLLMAALLFSPFYILISILGRYFGKNLAGENKEKLNGLGSN